MSDQVSPLNIPAGVELTHRSAAYRLPGQVAALAVILKLPAARQEAASQIKGEVERLQQSVKSKPVSSPNFPKTPMPCLEILLSVRISGPPSSPPGLA